MKIAKSRLTIIIVFGLLGILTGCSYEDNNDVSAKTPSVSARFTEEDKQFLHTLFHTQYLWYDRVPDSVNLTQYDTPQALIDAEKFGAWDHWSFALHTEPKKLGSYFDRDAIGFGIGFRDDLIVNYVQIHSPAWGKIRRGDTLLKINGNTANANLVRIQARKLDEATRFTLRRNGRQIVVSLTPRHYIRQVTLSRLFEKGDKTFGYLRCDRFSEGLSDELARRFDDLASAGLDEMIVDLRYNNGGDISQAVSLMEYLDGSHPGEIATHLRWNDRFRARDTDYLFASPPPTRALHLSRVFFLVTRATASASELVINGLKPYLDEVVVIGAPTDGKNVGMRAVTHNDYTYYLINFYVENAAGNRSSAQGISPACPAQDDLRYPMGDLREPMMRTAVYYALHGQCPDTQLGNRLGAASPGTHTQFVDGEKSLSVMVH